MGRPIPSRAPDLLGHARGRPGAGHRRRLGGTCRDSGRPPPGAGAVGDTQPGGGGCGSVWETCGADYQVSASEALVCQYVTLLALSTYTPPPGRATVVEASWPFRYTVSSDALAPPAPEPSAPEVVMPA